MLSTVGLISREHDVFIIVDRTLHSELLRTCERPDRHPEFNNPCCSPSCVTDETIGTHFGYVDRSRSNGRTASIDAANSTVRETVNAIAEVSRVRTEYLGRPEPVMERVVVGSHLFVRHFQLPSVRLAGRSADRPQIMMSVAPSPSMFCVGAATVSLHDHRQAQVETTSA